jgi:hypothetical protein
MKKSDVMVADITIYAMKQIRMAKYDRKLTGETDYWNGEILALKYLLLYLDKLNGKKKENDIDLPHLIELFNRVDPKRKETFEALWENLWEYDLDEEF